MVLHGFYQVLLFPTAGIHLYTQPKPSRSRFFFSHLHIPAPHSRRDSSAKLNHGPPCRITSDRASSTTPQKRSLCASSTLRLVSPGLGLPSTDLCRAAWQPGTHAVGTEDHLPGTRPRGEGEDRLLVLLHDIRKDGYLLEHRVGAVGHLLPFRQRSNHLQYNCVDALVELCIVQEFSVLEGVAWCWHPACEGLSIDNHVQLIRAVLLLEGRRDPWHDLKFPLVGREIHRKRLLQQFRMGMHVENKMLLRAMVGWCPQTQVGQNRLRQTCSRVK